jgi:hypothetical protein
MSANNELLVGTAVTTGEAVAVELTDDQNAALIIANRQAAGWCVADIIAGHHNDPSTYNTDVYARVLDESVAVSTSAASKELAAAHGLDPFQAATVLFIYTGQVAIH